MLPKIFVGWQKSVDDFAVEQNISPSKLVVYDGSTSQIDDLRDWLFFSNNLIRTDENYVLVIDNFDKLSTESQNILLKPLEEKPPGASFFLLAEKENGILTTILSRCEVKMFKNNHLESSFWSDFVRLVKLGPGEILDYCEHLPADQIEDFVNEIILRLKVELEKNINERRIKILKTFLDIKLKTSLTNVNKRLALEVVLIRSWGIAKT